MNEDILEVLIYIYEHSAENSLEPFTKSHGLQSELKQAGFRDEQIHHAFHWLHGIFHQTDYQVRHFNHHFAMRVYTDYEIKRLGVAGCDLLYFLENTGVVNPSSREIIIDRTLALGLPQTGLEHLCWVSMLVLASGVGQDATRLWIEMNREQQKVSVRQD